MARRDDWYFLTNYALVLIQVWQTPEMTVKSIAGSVGITERAVHRILAALVDEGYVTRQRRGRNNVYTVTNERKMRHPKVAHLEVGQLLRALRPSGS